MHARRAILSAGVGLGMSAMALFGTVGSAHAADGSSDYVKPAPVVQGEVVSAAPTGVAAEQVSPEQTSGPLPLTGSDVAELSAVGLALVGAGTIMVRRTRRKA